MFLVIAESGHLQVRIDDEGLIYLQTSRHGSTHGEQTIDAVLGFADSVDDRECKLTRPLLSNQVTDLIAQCKSRRRAAKSLRKLIKNAEAYLAEYEKERQ